MCKLNCKTCSSRSECSICQDGYFKSGGNCVACATNCKYCTSATVCTECYSEFFVKTGGSCSRCKDEGWIVSGLTCIKSCQTDIAECVLCKGLECIQCKPNFFINTLDKTKCITCLEKNQWKEGDGMCYKCSDNCVRCLNKDTCHTCAIGYFVKKDGKCDSCLTNCELCTDKKTCIKCTAEFFLRNDGLECNKECGDGRYVDGGENDKNF